METTHRIVVEDARDLGQVDDDSVELVVTSPPYPMIEMWDEVFAELNSSVGDALDAGAGREAFELMHEELDRVWSEVERVLVDGGIACVNVGDATRQVDGSFRVYQNHSRIVDAFEELGFEPLPELLWRKPVNSAAKFMGSGMLPPNAYVTLEHEYVLVFRNGKDSRSFEPGADRRYSAAYFWEERNRWFSDVWTDVTGELQSLDDDDLRDRSAAYPFEVPYRLVNMYSVYGDTVLDPFWGTGTTSLAALVAGRNSIGYELEAEFTGVFEERVDDVPRLSRDVIGRRLEAHREFVAERRASGDGFEYEAENYDFPVTTKQERPLQFYSVAEVERDDGGYRAVHEPVESAPVDAADDATE
ncbi:DNA-methyltransferase [Halomicrobium salinisoli]|uniref:DNA-methyltransferase n=1 Tax=Halomicrobium salinisoli TaxID=2878391 RepID=UPI001CF08E78|nr:site-specific DNA-methyltransferase [Halomicrobium salinisoli]